MSFQFGSGSNAPGFTAQSAVPASWQAAPTLVVKDTPEYKHLSGVLNGAVYRIHRIENQNKGMSDENARMRQKIDELEQQNTDYHNRIAGLEGEADQQAENLRNSESENRSLKQRLEIIDQDVKEKERNLSTTGDELRQLQEKLEQQKEESLEQESAKEDLHASLDKTNADIADLQQKYAKALQDGNEWQVAHRDVEMQLESLREEWDDREEQIQQLQAANDQLPLLEQQISELSNDAEELKNRMEDKERHIAVLNVELQKKNTELLKEKASRIAAADGDANVIRDSLEDEILAAEEELDEGPFEELEESGIITIIDMKPHNPTLTFSKLATSATEPAALTPAPLSFSDITSASTQPLEPEPLPKPKLSLATILQKSTVPKDPELPPLALSSITTTIDEAPVATDLSTHILLVDKKPSLVQTALPYIIFLLVLLCAYFWTIVRAWEGANTSTYRRNTYGAYGTPSHFLGVIPIGWDVGDGYISTTMAKWTAIIFQRIEEWAEVDRTPYM